MPRKRSLGPGPQVLTQGTDMKGFYGLYTGICTPNELISIIDLNRGEIADGVNGNTNITWMKFSYNYKTLFIADRGIKSSVSWDHINGLRCIRGRVIDIGDFTYKCRVPTGADSNPSTSTTGGNNDNLELSKGNNEWDDLIVEYCSDNDISHWNSKFTWCQEVRSISLAGRVYRGLYSVRYFSGTQASSTSSSRGFRPVLEVL